MGIALRPRRSVDAKTGEVTEVPAMESVASPAKKPKSDGTDEFVPTVPLMLDIAADIRDQISADLINDDLIKARRALYFDLGVPFPGIQLRFNEQLPAGSYTIMLSEVPVAMGRIRPRHLLVREPEATLRALLLEIESDKPFLPGIETIWVDAAVEDSLQRAGLAFMKPSQIVTYHLATVLRKYSSDFIGVQETRFLLSAMEQRFPDLVKEAMRVMPVQKIGEILQRSGLRGHLHPQSAIDPGGLGGVGPEGEGLGAADGVCSRGSQASHQSQVLGRAEHAAGLSAGPSSRRGGAGCHSSNVGGELSGAGSEYEQAVGGQHPSDGGATSLHRHPPRAVGFHGHPPLHEKAD
jgi:hypothetical protein